MPVFDKEWSRSAGAAPGGWTAYLAARVGRVLAVDSGCLAPEAQLPNVVPFLPPQTPHLLLSFQVLFTSCVIIRVFTAKALASLTIPTIVNCTAAQPGYQKSL